MFIYQMSLFSLCLFVRSFISTFAFLFVSLHASFFISLFWCFLPSLYPSLKQTQSYISGVDQIFKAHMDSSDRHKSWVFLKCPCRVLQTACSEQEMLCGTRALNSSLLLPVSSQIPFSYLFLSVNLCLVPTFPLPPCLSSWTNSTYMLIRMHLPKSWCLNIVHSQPERWLIFKGTILQKIRKHVCGLIPLFFHITYWLCCRHDNKMFLWQHTNHKLDFWVF